MSKPTVAVLYMLSLAAFTTIVNTGTFGEVTFAECNGPDDIVSGQCNSFAGELIDAVSFGTIPGAPGEVNFLFLFIGLSCRLTVLVWMFEKAWYLGLLTLLAGAITALISWLT